MKKSLLKYYQSELNYLRNEGDAFAKAYPKIGNRLCMGEGNTEDPLVGTLIESFAFLTARINYKIDRQMQSASQSILNLLYPNYLSIIPSLSTVQIKNVNNHDETYNLPKNTELSSKTTDGKSCVFRTCYPLTIYPIKITDIYFGCNFKCEQAYKNKKTKSALSIRLQAINPAHNIKVMNINNLDFYINTSTENAYLIQQILFKNISYITITSESDETVTIYPESLVSFLGFDDEENLFPSQKNAEIAQNLLMEFFLYPKKYLYFRLKHLSKYVTDDMGCSININIYFNNYQADLVSIINKKTFLLGCSPVINLFEINSVPVVIDQKINDYPVIPDNDFDMAECEIYHINNVNVISEYKNMVCRPFFGYKYADDINAKYLHWYHYKKSSEEIGRYHISGYESFINVSFKNIEPTLNNKTSIVAEMLCANKFENIQLTQDDSGKIFAFKDAETSTNLAAVSLSEVTAPVYQKHNTSLQIDIIALIALRQKFLEDNENTKQQIQNVLSMSCLNDKHYSDLIMHGIQTVDLKKIIKPIHGYMATDFSHGIKLRITINKKYFPENNELLFGYVLYEYLNKTCDLNTFVDLTFIDESGVEINQWKKSL